MTIGEFKQLCEKWEIEDDVKLEFGIDQKTHKIGSFFFANNTVLFEKVDDPISENRGEEPAIP